MGASVIAHGDAAPVLQASEHLLDEVAAFVEFRVLGNELDAVLSSWDAWDNIALMQDISKPVRVVSTVRDPGLCVRRQTSKDVPCAFVVADLPLCEQQNQGLAVAIANRVQLRVQPAFGPPYTPRSARILARLAAVRWAFRCVASIITVSVTVHSEASSANIRPNTPACDQRTKRL